MNINRSIFGKYTVDGVDGHFEQVMKNGFHKFYHYPSAGGRNYAGGVPAGNFNPPVKNTEKSDQIESLIKKYIENGMSLIKK